VPNPIELQGVVLEAKKSIESRDAYAAQADRIRALEAEVAQLKDWNAEKSNYELKTIGWGSVAYMLKPEKRGSEAPHWLCPNCFANGKKSFLNFSGASVGRRMLYKCGGCDGQPVASENVPAWGDE
jgi:hypothetical protein